MKNIVLKGTPINTRNSETIVKLSNPNSTLFEKLKSTMEPEVSDQLPFMLFHNPQINSLAALMLDMELTSLCITGAMRKLCLQASFHVIYILALRWPRASPEDFCYSFS